MPDDPNPPESAAESAAEPPPTVVGGVHASGASDAPLGALEAFGAYRIERELGRGGMSVVYEAVHRQRGRPEALKVLHRTLADDPTVGERFHREIRAMAGLHQHDHVVALYDSGEFEGRLYYTMPVLPGPTWAELLGEIRATGETVPGAKANAVLDAHGVPPSLLPDDPPAAAYARRIAASLVGVAEALGAMHAQDVLHRDLKPSNLMLDHARRVVVADFGIARTKDQRITGDEEWLGTPAYMSPEQIIPREDGLDGRADVYAFGATLYEMLTLRLPHEGDTIAETLAQVLRKRPVPVRDLNPGAPRDLVTIVARCLESDPKDRYPDAVRLAGDLSAFAHGSEIRTRPVGWIRRAVQLAGRNRKAIAAGFLVLVVALGYYLTRPGRLTLRTLPNGEVRVDGAAMGRTPLSDLELAPGVHRVVVHPAADLADVFESLELEVVVGRMEHAHYERYLPARDPASVAAIREYTRANQLKRTEVNWLAARARSLPPAPGETVTPRGRVRRVPDSILLALAGEPGEQGVRVGSRGGDTKVLRTWEEIRAPRDGAEAGAKGALEALDEAASLRIDERLEAVTRGFEAGAPAADFLVAEVLLEEALYLEAFDAAVRLRKAFGDRQEVARLGLAALDGAGLHDTELWDAWTAWAVDARE